MNELISPRVVRINVTAEQWQRLKVEAIYAGRDLGDFLTAALRVSPLTDDVFAPLQPKEQTQP